MCELRVRDRDERAIDRDPFALGDDPGGLLVRACRGARLGVEPAERDFERPDGGGSELLGKRGDDLRGAERELVQPGGIVDDHLQTVSRERSRLSAPGDLGSYQRPPAPPDHLLDEPVTELRDGGREDVTDGARRR